MMNQFYCILLSSNHLSSFHYKKHKSADGAGVMIHVIFSKFKKICWFTRFWVCKLGLEVSRWKSMLITVASYICKLAILNQYKLTVASSHILFGTRNLSVYTSFKHNRYLTATLLSIWRSSKPNVNEECVIVCPDIKYFIAGSTNFHKPNMLMLCIHCGGICLKAWKEIFPSTSSLRSLKYCLWRNQPIRAL